MIVVNNIETWGFEHALRGMRNPLNSWDISDSHIHANASCMDCEHLPFLEVCDKHVTVGESCLYVCPADLDLMRRLYKAGSEHRKYLRQIFISMDINAPWYWWKEADQYRIGVTTNSCSSMHTIHKKEFTLDDFSTDHLEDFSWNRLEDLIVHLNICREKYLETKDKKWWWQIIQLLPSSYNQKRTITMSYENAVNMIHQRKNHKLDEWREFVEILLYLPYMKEIMGEE